MIENDFEKEQSDKVTWLLRAIAVSNRKKYCKVDLKRDGCYNRELRFFVCLNFTIQSVVG